MDNCFSYKVASSNYATRGSKGGQTVPATEDEVPQRFYSHRVVHTTTTWKASMSGTRPTLCKFYGVANRITWFPNKKGLTRIPLKYWTFTYVSTIVTLQVKLGKLSFEVTADAPKEVYATHIHNIQYHSISFCLTYRWMLHPLYETRGGPHLLKQTL